MNIKTCMCGSMLTCMFNYVSEYEHVCSFVYDSVSTSMCEWMWFMLICVREIAWVNMILSVWMYEQVHVYECLLGYANVLIHMHYVNELLGSINM